MTPPPGNENTASKQAAPRCRHFGQCGGCQLQHLDENAQLRLKESAVRAKLEAAGVPAPALSTHAATGYGYRNRIRLRVVGGRVGYSRAASNEFLPVDECPIASPLLWRTAAAMQQAALGGDLWPTGSSELELATDADESQVQLLLHVDATVQELDRDAPQQFRALCDAVKVNVPPLAGGGLLARADVAGTPRRVQERQRVEVARWGSPFMEHLVDGRAYQVSRGAFFQVNRFLTGRMVDLVVGNRSGDLAWDLFAGAGLFSVPLAERFRRVVAVEVGQPAASDLQRTLQGIGPQHRAVAQPVHDFLKTHGKETPGLIVMDPPRAGLSLGMARRLASIGSPELVYVSCDAGTFARDARALLDSRYTLTELHLLDLFPQTSHTETIAVFRRA